VTAVGRAIEESLPERPGQRHRKTFELARRLLGIPAVRDAPPKALHAAFAHWWQLAKPRTSGTHDFEDALEDFLNAWQNCKRPWGETIMSDVLTRAKMAEPPEAVAEFPTPAFRVLAGLCRELQREAGDGPFFLSTHTAAELLGTKPMVIWRWLRLLSRLGVLELVTKGNRKRASEFRYLGN